MLKVTWQQLDLQAASRKKNRHLVNAYEGKAGMVYLSQLLQ